MDIRETIIQAVMERLTGKVDIETANTVENILVIQLNKYEVQERCTDLVAMETESAESLLRKFIATKRVGGRSESTLKRYEDEIYHLILFMKKPVEEITTYDLRFYLSWRREYKGNKHSTLDGVRRCINSFFAWMASEKRIQHNPCLALQRVKQPHIIRDPFGADDLEKLRMACKSTRDRALVEFLYSTGCRVSEVANLNISDVRFNDSEVRVFGKGSKERTVYLTDVAIMYLKEYLSGKKHQTISLFAGKGSERLKKNGIEALLKRLGKAAGVENVHPHRFRRTLASDLLARGMTIQDVAAILGHEDLKTTQVYCKIKQRRTKAAFFQFAA